ncbi:hypothetical protein SAMN05878503_10796 [Cereibacter ovatus]|uniref:Uncharacterized protein n=1 Tax=Cereibacter ovatus TaxID=439529 RepID=A0A285CTX5_9RHOB|nr:hypothetical protein SAMN05878503_10796 [Cereibacter ovatus]
MRPLPEPGFHELLRQALEGFLPAGGGLTSYLDRMERQA